MKRINYKEQAEEISKEIKEFEKTSNDNLDGDNLHLIRKSGQESNKLFYHNVQEELIKRNIKFDSESEGIFVIYNKNKSYYYFPKNEKWRVKGKNIFYRCKDVNDLLDRFILK